MPNDRQGLSNELLAKMLGWGNTPPTEVLERDLREKMRRLRILEGYWAKRQLPPEDLSKER